MSQEASKPAEEKKEKPYRSPSQINLYLGCGEAYRRRYVMGEKIPPGIVALQGTGVHRAAETNFRQKVESREDLPLRDMVEIAVTNYEADAEKGGVMLSDEERSRGSKVVIGEGKDQLVSLAEFHAKIQAPDYQPKVVEATVRIELPNSPDDILGRLDIIDERLNVTDFKVAGRRKRESDVQESTQLTFYAAAAKILGIEPKEVRLDVIVKNKTPVRQILRDIRTRADFAAFAAKASAVIDGIRKGVFLPAPPGSWMCSPKYCGYFSTCPFVNSERKAAAEASE